MPSLLTLAILYAGIGGAGADKVDSQVRAMLEAETEIADADVTKAERAVLIGHGAEAKEIVARLDVTGLIAGKLETTKKGATLTLVVYGHDGAMVDLVDLPLGKSKKKAIKLAAADLESLHDTVIPDVQQLLQVEQEAAEEQRRREEAAAEDDRVATTTEETATTAEAAPRARHPRDPMVRLAVGAGPVSRTYTPDVAGLHGYRASPVPVGRVTVEVTPLRFVELGGVVERTLTMHSDLSSGSAPTWIFHWQATAAARLPLGGLELAAFGGVGDREFVIEKAAATPDVHYLYALVGGRVGARVGGKLELRGAFAYEPVIGGTEDTAATLGSSSRAGLEVTAIVRYAATGHLFVAAEGGYHRLTTTWDTGSAVDEFPSGALSLGASF